MPLQLFCAVTSFVELTSYLLKFPSVFTGSGGELLWETKSCWQNPTVQACVTNAQSQRVQGSLAMDPVRGNSSRKRRCLNAY
jgi:hypothetical protein